MAFVEEFLEILKKPTIGDVFAEMFMFLGPVWFAFLLGIILGWAWKPRWASLGNCKFDISAPPSPSAFISSSMKDFASVLRMEASNSRGPSFGSSSNNIIIEKEHVASPVPEIVNSRSSKLKKEDSAVVTDGDLKHLYHLVERKDGGPAWKHMMDHSTSNMSYQSWQRDMENGPPQYCSRTVYEDATPEQLRDFFWDDDFRLKWDDMLVHAFVLEECPTTGTMMVHWVRKFPFFCSDREYIIGRRIWESGRSYYCITQGVPCDSVPRKDKPRRVDQYYSSWYIQAVESQKANGQLTACEVLLFHHEDMGIPWEIAKFGVKQGMWGAVKKIERGFRAYQRARTSTAPPSHHAFMAQVNTKIDPDYMRCLENDEECKETEETRLEESTRGGPNIPKLLLLGGAVAVACSLDRGLLTKGIILSMTRRFGNIGKRACPRT
ncbi:hypothetical protein LIER_20042 [Lithospermum erythrorhizon]|uniref:START domain-containing protein n=1 Tax=Lithospermum erythrorhizon TaxID=34254 RepID=A0AAV3QN25_LITER